MDYPNRHGFNVEGIVDSDFDGKNFAVASSLTFHRGCCSIVIAVSGIRIKETT